MMERFRQMVNFCIRIGIQNDVATTIQLSKLCYRQLEKYDIYPYYKLCAISHAAGILANRRKSIKRGFAPRQPYAKRGLLTAYLGFKVENGAWRVPLGNRKYLDIPFNNYVKNLLAEPSLRIRSFTVTSNLVSICYSKEVPRIECTSTVGVDRNLRNLTIGNNEKVVQYNLAKTADIVESTRSIVRSFKRNDVKIRKKLAFKYGQRRKNRVTQLLHHVSKAVVEKARGEGTAIAFEDITHIRRLYRRGNGQSRDYRSQLNSWSFAAIKHQIEYKASWEGLPVIQLSVRETRNTSQLCPRCRKKITQVDRRQLWCAECKRWMDRDVVAAMNISIKGRSRFERSQGAAGEAVRGNPMTAPIILRVDAAKLSHVRHRPKV